MINIVPEINSGISTIKTPPIISGKFPLNIRNIVHATAIPKDINASGLSFFQNTNTTPIIISAGDIDTKNPPNRSQIEPSIEKTSKDISTKNPARISIRILADNANFDCH